MPLWQLTKDAQITQAAQAGYAADYQNKRLPIAVHEVKEWMKAQSKLIEELEDQKPGYLGARPDCWKLAIFQEISGAVFGSSHTIHVWYIYVHFYGTCR